MTMEVKRNGDLAVVRPGAELNLVEADDFRLLLAELASDGVHSLILDCEQLVRVDSSGLGALIFTRRDLEERGCRIALAAVPERMKDLLRLSGLLDYFPVYAEVENARSGIASEV